MNQAHKHDPRHINLLIGILLQQICHDSHMPGMLRIVLVASVTTQVGLTENVFFFIDLEDKIQLFL